MRNIYLLIIFILTPLFILAQGNVGIGTTVPVSRLDVNGGITIGSNYSGTVAAPVNGAVIEGRLGLGLTTPTAQLHVVTADSMAIRIEGISDLRGAVRNEGIEFGGSVAVNDGLTVGDLSGASCDPSIASSCSFLDTLPSFQFFSGKSTTYSNSPTCDIGDCRDVTNLFFEVEFYDFDGFPIQAEIYIRDQFLFTINIPNAKDSLWKASGNTSVFNGMDPNGINWFTYAINFGPDTDLWRNYNGTISYDYADSSQGPTFAAFGEVRASGNLYANSISEYGDVAEFMAVKSTRKPEPGDIVAIDRENPNGFVLTTQANDPLVAGVISENPSIHLNAPEAGEPIALTGRVQVKVNTEGGVIRLGDPITSSSATGVGKKADKNGMIIGRALEAFDGSVAGEGKIWVLLANVHHERFNEIKIVQGRDIQLAGLEVSGSKTIKGSTKKVFVAWDEAVKVELPEGIDFEDLVVDLNALGGLAEMALAEVNNEGFTVAIGRRTNSFQGFSYEFNIVSPALHSSVWATGNSSNTLDDVAVEDARLLYQDWTAAGSALKSASSMSMDVPANISSLEEAKAYKQAVLDSWRAADRKTYNRYMALGNMLTEKVKQHPELMNTFRSK